ncbi:MAG: alpha/beta hydrolase family protein [Planctomycetota bacterium]|jgi:pimeloyl-ACP methyl ester carboxylesterase
MNRWQKITWVFLTSGFELRVVFKIHKESNGKLTGMFDSPDQGVKDIPVDEIAFENGELSLNLNAILAVFEGKMNKNGLSIEGLWKQGQTEFPLVLKRVDKIPQLRRPQEPKRPYPYNEEEVVYKNEKAGIKLAGTLTLPRSKGPFSAVLLITGSGPQDRNESLLADHLTRCGIAVLRVDDREIGGSTGNFSEATSEDFASDVLAGIKYLKSRKEINPEHIGLIGHSEGGLIAPMAAANSPDDVAFIVMMAGPGLNGEELLHLQGTSILKAAGASEKLITYCRAHRERMFNILRTEKNNAIAEKKLLELGEKAEAELNEEEKELLKSFESGELGMQLMLSPWYRWYLTYDPKSSLTKVKCPVLAIIGELDLQVAPKENLRAIEEVLKAGGNKSYTIKELANLNHLFQTAQTGELSEYGKIEETISPIALKLIADWILEQTEKGGGQSPLKGEKT